MYLNLIIVIMKESYLKNCQEFLERAEPNEIVILSHADHDGLTSDCLIDLIYYDSYKSFIKRFHPSKEFGYSAILHKILSLKPKYFLIIDALVKPYEKIIKKNIGPRKYSN